MATDYPILWQSVGTLPAQQYVCGFCGASVAPDQGWQAQLRGGPRQTICAIYICHHCNGPTFIDPSRRQFPGVPFGDNVGDITDNNIAVLYEEARRATAATAFTATVLCCRKS